MYAEVAARDGARMEIEGSADVALFMERVAKKKRSKENVGRIKVRERVFCCCEGDVKRLCGTCMERDGD